jgi:hypothetical protein
MEKSHPGLGVELNVRPKRDCVSFYFPFLSAFRTLCS